MNLEKNMAMETNYEPVYIKIHYRKFIEWYLLALVILSCLLLLSICGLPEWLETRMENSPKYKYPWFVARYVLVNLLLLYTLPQFLWIFWRIFYIKKPLLIITQEGFTDYSGYTACGFMSWKDVKNINREAPSPPIGPLDNKYHESSRIMVAVKNLKKTLQAIPFIRRKIIELSMRFEFMNDRRFSIGLKIARCSLPDVLETMQAYKAEYDRINQIGNEAKSPKKITDDKL